MSIEGVLRQIPKPSVFFADRVSRGVITLAQSLRERGALIVFEPSGVSDPSQFTEMLALTHVLKYSQERLPDLEASVEVPLVIETMGRGGLRYKSRLSAAKSKGWVRCEPYKLNRYVDTAGAGDWCTAGILNVLGRHGAKAFNQIGTTKLLSAISFGQALAAWNCGFHGARGGMYLVSKEEFQQTLRQIMDQHDCVNLFVSEGACVSSIVAQIEARGEEVPRDAFGHVRLDKVNVGAWFARQFAEMIGAEKTLVQKSGYYSRAAAANAADRKLIKRCATKAVQCAFAGKGGVVGEDEERGDKLRAVEFERIKGGKPFNVQSEWFVQMLKEIGQPMGAVVQVQH